MPRPLKSIRPLKKSISIPEELAARVDLLLYSELEQKVPYAAWSQLIERLLEKHLSELQGGLHG